MEEHCHVSCTYKAEVYNRAPGGPGAGPAVVNLLNGTIDDKSRVNPALLQSSLTPTKSTLLSAIGTMQCVSCNKEAVNICSAIQVYRSDGEIKVVEQLILCCNDVRCISKARQRRNGDARKGRVGLGFGLSFRCAMEPMSKFRIAIQGGQKQAQLEVSGDKHLIENVNFLATSQKQDEKKERTMQKQAPAPARGYAQTTRGYALSPITKSGIANIFMARNANTRVETVGRTPILDNTTGYGRGISYDDDELEEGEIVE